MDDSEALKLLVLDYWVLFGELLLLLGQVVKCALVRLGMTVSGAEDVGTLARVLHEAHFLVALPALIRICLKT